MARLKSSARRFLCPHVTGRQSELRQIIKRVQYYPDRRISCQECDAVASPTKLRKEPMVGSMSHWMCLDCEQLFCGVEVDHRAEGHIRDHSKEMGHPLAVRIQVFCMHCEYVQPTTAEKGVNVDKESVMVVEEGSEQAVDNSNSRSNMRYIVRGMPNNWNACYFNSVLQNLLAMNSLREYFLSLESSNGPITKHLQNLFKETCYFNHILDPNVLLQTVRSDGTRFVPSMHQDSQELLNYLLNELRKEGMSRVDDIFGGKLFSIVSCAKCGNKLTQYEPFLDLSLPVPLEDNLSDPYSFESKPISSPVVESQAKPLTFKLGGKRKRETSPDSSNTRQCPDVGSSPGQSGDLPRLLSECVTSFDKSLNKCLVAEQPRDMETLYSSDLDELPLAKWCVKRRRQSFSDKLDGKVDKDDPGKSMKNIVPKSPIGNDVKKDEGIEELSGKKTSEANRTCEVEKVKDKVDVKKDEGIEEPSGINNCEGNADKTCEVDKVKDKVDKEDPSKSTVISDPKLPIGEDLKKDNGIAESSCKKSSEADDNGGLSSRLIDWDAIWGFSDEQYGLIVDDSFELDKQGKSIMLEWCLDSFTELENLRERICEQCKHDQLQKRYLISSAPHILTIHLKRFTRTVAGFLKKLEGHVRFNDSLDLMPYMDPGSVGDERFLYRLLGIVEHRGGLSNGHYVAYLRGERRQEDDGGPAWYMADDNVVQYVSLDEILARDAYILFYERRKS